MPRGWMHTSVSCGLRESFACK